MIEKPTGEKVDQIEGGREWTGEKKREREEKE